MTTTVTDLADLRRRLTAWLAARTGGPVEISEVARPDGNGLSSVSLLFDAVWPEDGRETRAGLVVRMPPDATSYPVFPRYDLRRQYDVISAVAAHTDVPVPRLRWIEESPDALGVPFIVMDRIDGGRVPVDNPPYVFGGWLLDAAPEQRRQLQDGAVRALAGVHALPDVHRHLPTLADETQGDALRALVEEQRAYYDWALAGDGVRVPQIEEAFDWLEAHWPADPGETVLCWGDARPGNIIYDGFAPVAVLDWEMCALGPREVDLGWMIFLHRFFQDIAEMFEFPGIPDLFRTDDVVACYQSASGHTVHDLDFFLMFAALRHAIVMARIKRRSIHFGEDTVPPTADEYVLFHTQLRRMLDGGAP
ncbi:phosphotransferase family protein [Cryptosporangium phraense]|uniref:Phosphotransferase family protein n=1 Tax=Cryptosporangium phraense TaxID=2593070 RepID=A0A545AN12_9ACTN|nr:phosphotransferase family protein [Cryptosporangium phraense]TQS42135.1 phosphotransferase family protein [Cryptosporangium phraense]